MRIIRKNQKSLFALSFVSILIIGLLLPVTHAIDITQNKGFDKGPSYTSVIPIKKASFVAYDDKTLLDDYAYLAAVPTAVFTDQETNKIFSNPLIFYQDPYEITDDKERSFNAYQGIDYFMEDWMKYCGQLDQMTLINVQKDKVLDWRSHQITEIESNNPYNLANQIALNEWSYSDNAVVAVIDDEFEGSDFKLNSEISGELPANQKVIKETFFAEQLDKLNPRPHYFDVPEGYKYFKARTWWSCLWFGTPAKSAFPIHINATIPAADPDTQFYCQYEDEWMEVAATQGWNIGGMDKEKTEAYIFNTGKWYYTLTDIPTEGIGEYLGKFGKITDVIKNMIKGARYQTDITLYPGIEQEIPESPPFNCRDITFKLTWGNPNVKLGLTLLGPYGEEIYTSCDNKDYQEIHLDQLGELPDDEKYKVSVFILGEISSSVDYKIEYSWHQNYTVNEGNALSSATEGAVLASTLNAPLLYTSKDNLPQYTEDALYKLGVKNVFLVNIGNTLINDAEIQIKEIVNIEKEYVKLEQIYEEIIDTTGNNDIIFSTIDPWTYWYVEDMKPGGETEAGLFIGPAAYCAAHHGSPVLIVDMHPELSSAIVWHTEFWKRYANGYQEPTVANMYLTVTNVIKFLKRIGIDKEGIESMITVAGQFEIGATWDRAFVGNTNPGRFFGSPVDTAYWISRSMFYPALIFNNPGMSSNGVELEQGSSSERRTFLPYGAFGLKITKGKDKNFKFPVLQMYLTYNHYLNDRFNKYYQFKYETSDHIIFGETPSNNPIDTGLVPGKEGQQIWPDYTDSEVTPMYLEKGGYSNVFSTNFEPLMENLNKGVLLFISHSHGSPGKSGKMLTWNPGTSAFGLLPSFISNRFGYVKESNPWRGYEWMLGSTEEPDTMTMEVHGIIPALLGNPNMQGLVPLGLDYFPTERPIYNKITKLLSFIPIIRRFIPEWVTDNTYYKDGLVGASTISGWGTSSQQWSGYNMDDKLDNIYSCGWLNTACLPAYKYMHLTMVRHGSAFQVIDPWSTSWYAYWSITMPRDIILGDTVGEAFAKGISHVGILYATDPPQWWWDTAQNVCYFGDPDIRMYVPSTDYSDKNTWDKPKALLFDDELSLNGHMPYGVTSYPYKKEKQSFFEKYLVIIFIIVIVIILLIIFYSTRGKKKNK